MSKLRSANPGWPIVLLSTFLCVVFLAFAGVRLAGVEQMAAIFDKISLGQRFPTEIAVIEVIGAIGLLIGAARFYAAALLVCTMGIAAVEHLFVIGGDPIPAILLFLLTAIVAYCTHPAVDMAAA